MKKNIKTLETGLICVNNKGRINVYTPEEYQRIKNIQFNDKCTKLLIYIALFFLGLGGIIKNQL